MTDLEICRDEASFAEECSRLVMLTASKLVPMGAHAAVAESLTGGLISSEIVRAAGSSRWFKEGCVTYAEEAKIRRLGVLPESIERFTAVSSKVAGEMAAGVLNSSESDIAVAATGLAGPGADEYGRPAGLVFIGGACRQGFVTKKLSLSGDRLEVRRQAALAALRLLAALAELL